MPFNTIFERKNGEQKASLMPLSEKALIAMRPLSASEKKDITVLTKHLLERLKDRSKNDINGISDDNEKASEYAKKAIVRLVYVGFGFRVMREYAPNDAAWRDFLKKNFNGFPLVEYVTAERYIIIGKHFYFDQNYIDFLSGLGYPVDPIYYDQKQPIITQIEDLKKKGIQLHNTSDLLKLAKTGQLPEISDPKAKRGDVFTPITPVDPVISSEIIVSPSDISSPRVEPPSDTDSSNYVPPDVIHSTTDKDVTSKVEPVDIEDKIAKGLLEEIRDMLKILPSAKNLLRSRLERRPLSQLEIRSLMDDLRPAKEMIDQLIYLI
jgi:hypothetical protein